MDRGWFIGQERIPQNQSEEQLSKPCSNVSRPRKIINLTEMLQFNKPDAKKHIPIRPPSPRISLTKNSEFSCGLSCEPRPKSIIRRRSRSLPSTTERKRRANNVGVRFIDSLGLDLENVKLFTAREDPFVPFHVAFRLLMSAELADGKDFEICLPFLKPIFAHQPGDQPEFLDHIYCQKVCLERVLCFELGIVGITQVLNLDFEKEVNVRYSFTEWKSYTETKASWVSMSTKPCDGSEGHLSFDTFRFHLPVPPFLHPGAVLEFAIQYKVCGAEYWDNNDGQNYKLVCHNHKLTVPKECEDSLVHFI